MVGADWPVLTLSKHKHKCDVKNCLSSHSCHFVKILFNQIHSCICSACLHCEGKVSNCYTKSCDRYLSAHEGTIFVHTKAIFGRNCLSIHSCHFVNNHLFYTKLLHAYVQRVYTFGKVSKCSHKCCGRNIFTGG